MKLFTHLAAPALMLAVSLNSTLPATAADLFPPESVGLSADRLGRIDTVVQSFIDDHQIPGAVVAVARRGKLAYMKSFGQQDVEAKLPMETDTIFRIASMTKPITTVAAMTLLEEGLLQLDDPVSRYLPAFREQMVVETGADGKTSLVPVRREVTIRDLLTHTSGISYRFWARPALKEAYADAGVSDGLAPTSGTLHDRISALAALPLLNHPGEAFEYGLNTDVLGAVIEVVADQPLDTVLKTRIFEPLGMKDTSFTVPVEKRSRLAALYSMDPAVGYVRADAEPTTWDQLIFSPDVPTADKVTYLSGGAGLTSTAADYLRFLQMILDGGQLDGKRILSRKSIEQMTSNQIGDHHPSDSLPPALGKFGTGFGFGFGVQESGIQMGIGSAGEFTWAGIFFTRFYVDPEEKLIVVMMAQRILGIPELEEKLHTLAEQAIVD